MARGSRERGARARFGQEITVFDSTGLAIQDLAIGIEIVNRYQNGADAGSFSDVQEIDIG